MTARNRILVVTLTSLLTIMAGVGTLQARGSLGDAAACAHRADATACVGAGPFFMGMASGKGTSPISTSGAQAQIGNYYPRYCAASGAWAAITNIYKAGNIAQVGWARNTAFSTSAVYFFWEVATNASGDSGPQRYAVDTQAGNFGTDNKFTVYTDGNGTTQFILNGTGIHNARLDWTPNNAAWLGETHYSGYSDGSQGDQMPGDNNHFEVLYNVQHLYNGTWYNDIASTNKVSSALYANGVWPTTLNSVDIYDTRFGTEGP